MPVRRRSIRICVQLAPAGHELHACATEAGDSV